MKKNLKSKASSRSKSKASSRSKSKASSRQKSEASSRQKSRANSRRKSESNSKQHTANNRHKSKANCRRTIRPNSWDDSQTSRCVQSRRNEMKSELVVQEIEDEDAGVKDDALSILSLDKPGWRRATRTCNDVQRSAPRSRQSHLRRTSQQNQVLQRQPGGALWRFNRCSS